MSDVKKISIYGISSLGAVGTGLQNYVAVAALLKGMNAVTKLGMGVLHGLAIAVGGVTSGLINFCINVELLEDFAKRLTEKPMPNLSGWQKFRYWLGSAVFVVTGVLFGLTTFAFGSIGLLGALSVAAGIFVAIIMVIQELETWLSSFDEAAGAKNKRSIKQIFIEWKQSLTMGKVLGIGIALGNVLALSSLFALGLASFLTGVGVAATPALVIGVVVAFTGGAFTEFYFYNRFLSGFCSKLGANLQRFMASKYSPFGLICNAVNAMVNAALCYVGMTMLVPLFVAANMALPPMGVVTGIIAAVSACAGLASLILGMDFWQRNSERLPDVFAKQVRTSTATMTKQLSGQAPKSANDEVLLVEKSQSAMTPAVSMVETQYKYERVVCRM